MGYADSSKTLLSSMVCSIAFCHWKYSLSLALIYSRSAKKCQSQESVASALDLDAAIVNINHQNEHQM